MGIADTLHRSDDYGSMLSDLYARVYNIEQIVTSPQVMGVSVPDDLTVESITVDDGVGTPIVMDLVTEAATGLSLSWSSYYDEIYIDATWDAPLDPAHSAGFQLDLSKQISPGVWDIKTSHTTVGTAYRFRSLEPNTTYKVEIYGVNPAGARSASTYATVATGQDNSVPPAVTGVTLARGATSAIVSFTPLTAVQAPDVANGAGLYLIELSTASDYSVTTRTTRTSAQVVQFGDLTAATTYYARVAAIDSSGNQGPWANSSAFTAGGVIENMMVGTFTGALITVGTLNGDRIVANTADVNVLTTSSLTSANITLTGGSFKAGTPVSGSGILINSQGIRLYSGGVLKVTLDVGGTASFTGSITASTISSTTISASSFTWGTGSLTSTNGLQIQYAPVTNWWLFPDRNISFYSSFGTLCQVALTALGTSSDSPQYSVRLFGSSANYVQFDAMVGGSPTAINTIYLTCNTLDATPSHFFANVKSFRIPHPLKSDWVLTHAVVEGPENGVFYRGRGKIDATGQVRVPLPAYFAPLTRVESRTLNLTPIGDGRGAWGRLEAGEVEDTGFVVHGNGGQEFYWMVFAERADVPRLVVEEEADREHETSLARVPAYDEHVASSFAQEVQNIIDRKVPALA